MSPQPISKCKNNKLVNELNIMLPPLKKIAKNRLFLFSIRNNQDTYLFSICEDKNVQVQEPIEESPPPKTDKEVLEEIRMAYSLQPRGRRVMGLVPL